MLGLGSPGLVRRWTKFAQQDRPYLQVGQQVIARLPAFQLSLAAPGIEVLAALFGL